MVRLLIMFVVMSALGCGTFGGISDRAMTVANASILAINAAQLSVESLYEATQLAVLTDSAAKGHSNEEVRERLTRAREEWGPTIELFEQAHTAHAALVKAAELRQGVAEALLHFTDVQKQLAVAVNRIRAVKKKEVPGESTYRVLESSRRFSAFVAATHTKCGARASRSTTYFRRGAGSAPQVINAA